MLLIALLATAPVTVLSGSNVVEVANGRVDLKISRGRGTWQVSLGNPANPEASFTDIFGEARLSDGRTLRTTDFHQRLIGPGDVRRVRDTLGSGVRITVHDRDAAGPELRTVFWVYENQPEVIVRLELVSDTQIGSNYLAPIMAQTPAKIRQAKYVQSLFVPYDNDNYIRYRSDGPPDPNGNGSYEVGAAYDDESRNGVVAGSLDHDIWKSAVKFSKDESGDFTRLTAFCGVADKITHDTQPHGTVTGTVIDSPRMALGWYEDWRSGMERYGDLNAKVCPPLHWSGSVPFGWNSWAGHKEKVNAEDARAATEFIATELPTFRSSGTATINFDSFWDNLTLAQRGEFVKRAHAAGLKAGIYYSPFAGWSKLTDIVAGSRHTYRDLVLKDGNGVPIPQIDGAWPLDPTAPETLARIDRQLAEFDQLGFDFVKLDFMTLGALEGRHADPAVQTGNAAYGIGMRRVLDDLSTKKAGHPVFISLSIAPMFPQEFGHSRRISCDIFANIGATEYLLNSSAYGWWTNRSVYQFNDPDATCVYEPLGEPPVSEAEAQSRFTATVISGGMLLDGDDLTKPLPRERVKRLYSNPETIGLAKRALAFRPVFGNTGDKAGDTFEYVEPNRKSAFVAVFNCSKTDTLVKTITLARLGLSESAHWTVHDMWLHADRPLTSPLTVTLAPTNCTLIRLSSN